MRLVPPRLRRTQRQEESQDDGAGLPEDPETADPGVAPTDQLSPAAEVTRADQLPLADEVAPADTVEAAEVAAADEKIPPPAGPELRPSRPGWSLKKHLVLVTVVAALLLLGVGAIVTAEAFNRADGQGARLARFQAGVATAEITDAVPELRSLLVRTGNALGAATGGNLNGLARGRCPLSFGGSRSFPSGTLYVVQPDGTVVCSAPPAPSGGPSLDRLYADAFWLKPVLSTGAAVVTGPVFDPLRRQWVLFVAAPIATGGKTAGAVVVSADLTALAPALHKRFAGVEPFEYLVTDSKHIRVVSRSVDASRWGGKVLPSKRFARADAKGGVRLKDLDGRKRIYASKPVPGLGWHVYAGVSVAAAEGPARSVLWNSLAAGAVALAALALVTFSGLATVRRR